MSNWNERYTKEAAKPIQPADLSTTKGKITHLWRWWTVPCYEEKNFHPDNVKPAREETEEETPTTRPSTETTKPGEPTSGIDWTRPRPGFGGKK